VGRETKTNCLQLVSKAAKKGAELLFCVQGGTTKSDVLPDAVFALRPNNQSFPAKSIIE